MSVELLHGDWREVLAGRRADVVVTDIPYSERVEKGQRSADSLDASKLHYGSLGKEQCIEVVRRAAETGARRLVAFCDHTAFGWLEQGAAEAGWLSFAPVVWVKTDAQPRFGGDGPACSTEFVFVARERSRAWRPGSLPGHYITPRARDSVVVGGKPLNLMRAIVRDYTEPGDVVCDPFAGGGTTLLACLCEGREAFGAEIDADTYRKASERINAPQTMEMTW